MSYLLLLIYIAVLFWFITKSKFYNQCDFPRFLPPLIFIIKFLGGIMVYLVYAYFYGSRISGDIFKYFDDGNVIYSSLKQNPIDYLKIISGIDGKNEYLQKYYDTCFFWNKRFNYGLINDNRIVIRFNAIVRLFSMGNIHIHTLIMSFISFTGLWAIINVFYSRLKKYKWLLLLGIFFFPSVFFWTSGVLKEGILMFAFGMLLYHFVNALSLKKSYTNYIWIIICIAILLLSKFYVLVAALPGFLFYAIIKIKGNRYFWVKLTFSLLIFLVFSWFTKPIIGISFPEVLERKQHDFVAYINDMETVGSKINIPELEPTLPSILINSPGAFLRTLFRPTLLEVSNLMSLMAILENTLIVFLLVLTLVFFKKHYLKEKLLWFALLFILVLFTLTGLTTPVLGALVRYKAPALPFLGIAFLFLIDIEKIKHAWQKLAHKHDAIQ